MATYTTLQYQVENGVATLTLNRPESYNALNAALYTDFLAALKQLERDSAVRAVILTGAGKAFSSGADLLDTDISQVRESIGDVLRAGLNQMVLGLRKLEKPVICAINGVAAGAGSSLALACDYRLASENATFVFAAFVNIGLIPDAGGTYLLAQLVGTGKALELYLTADAKNRLSAAESHRLNIVNRVVSADELMTEAQALAQKWAAMPTKAIGLTKRAIYRAAERTLAEALEYEALSQTTTFRTHDFHEGVQAFIEKRAPVFKGE